ncbi:MAG: DNA polymerase I [Syntrophothermus sp.]
MGDKKVLAILDSHSLIHRAYFALPPLSSTKGEPTNAVYGFTMMLQRLLEEQKPDYVVAAFDKAAPTFRHVEFAEYKANRKQTPDDLRPQIPLVKEIVQAYRIPIHEVEGFEADDVIGTIARKAEEAGLEVLIFTGDRDSLQLVSPHVKAILTRKGITELEVYDEGAVREKLGVTPSEWIDVKALMGDASDNIPGVPGIGQKTAQKLIQEYGSVENLLENLDKLTGKQRELLAAYRDQALLSKRLATIVCDAPVDFQPEGLSPINPEKRALYELFQRFEFRGPLKKLLDENPDLGAALRAEAQHRRPAKEPVAGPITGSSTAPAKTQPGEVTEQAFQGSLFGAGGETVSSEVVFSEERGYKGKDYTVVATVAGFMAVIDEIAAGGRFGMSLWLDGPNPLVAQIRGIALCPEVGKGYFLPVESQKAPGRRMEGALQPGAVVEGLERLFAVKKSLVGHDLKAVWLALQGLGVKGLEITGEDFDVMVASYLAHPTANDHSLQAICLAYLGYPLPGQPEALDGGGMGAGDDIQAVAGYFCLQADLCLQLRGVLEPRLVEDGMEKLFREMEMPLVPVLAKMEARGVAIDVQRLRVMAAELEKRAAELTEEIYRLAGEPFNINSPRQLGAILFEKLKLPAGKKLKTGFSTSAGVLEELAEEHGIVAKILDYRQVVKLKSTYVDALPSLINPGTGRVHTTFNQTVTATGRLSSTNPNLQNIPIRTEEGIKIREAFVPGPAGYLLISADYSQIELRVLAHISQDPLLMEAFRSDQDIHTRTAAEVFGISPEEVTPQMRSGAKAINFGIVYGISSFGLAKGTGITRQAAQQYIDNYFERYAGVRAYIDAIVKKAREDGFVTTIFNRRRYLPDLHSRNWAMRSFAERTAMNTPIQGSAADIIKMAMLAVEEKLIEGRFATRMILQVHDELVFEAPAGEVEKVAGVIRRTMEEAVPLTVPLKVDVKVGPNWRDVRKI